MMRYGFLAFLLTVGLVLVAAGGCKREVGLSDTYGTGGDGQGGSTAKDSSLPTAPKTPPLQPPPPLNRK